MGQCIDRCRLPTWRGIAPLFDLSIKRPARANALAGCADVGDVRKLAKCRVPRMAFDFVDGAAGSEVSLTRARERFSRLEFAPRVLRNVEDINLSTDILGRKSPLPFFFAPTGANRLMHHEGEIAVARVAARLGIPYSLSTLGHTSVEALAAEIPELWRWFQLYVMSDRERTHEIIRRAETSGFDTLLLVVDTPVPGRRNRDVRNGLKIPPRITWKTALNIAGYPYWWFNKLTTPPIEFGMIDAVSERPEQRMAKVMDAATSLADLEWLRHHWSGKLVVKGIQSVEDAVMVAACGVDAVYLSTHGGRQLDRAPLPFDLLPAVRDALDGHIQVFMDGGVMAGSDIVACLARGATAVGIGRAYLYGLMAAGSDGVSRVAELLCEEIRTTLALVGCNCVNRATGIAVTVHR